MTSGGKKRGGDRIDRQTSSVFTQTVSLCNSNKARRFSNVPHSSVIRAISFPSSPSATMSFAIPRNVPSFQHPQRRLEDAVWGSSGNSRYTLSLPGSGGNDKELPMYKDKPYNYPPSRRRGRKRTYFLLAVVAGIVWLYYIGWFGGGEGGSGMDSGVIDVKGLLEKMQAGSASGRGQKVDWEQRREQVKKAMEISWAGYEKYAWGTFVT
jgi:mannosyl-oligosaccharide alpha-1,2-mannosidase